MSEIIKAYAKINLHLDITKKREDGYHNVETVMQSVSLYDTVEASFSDLSGITCECNLKEVPKDDKNIAVRAAKLYLQESGIKNGVCIKIEKRIPISAGLAGGSTDAAATLIALNRLSENRFSEQELCDLGSRLGADVPFCIIGGTSYSDGKGDILHQFPTIPEDTVLVVACGGEGVSTPWAYQLMDKIYNDFLDYSPKSTEALKKVLLSDSPDKFYEHLFNVFEKGVMSERPVSAEIKSIMLACGAKSALMSGSGPSVYGVFDNLSDAQGAVDAIRSNRYFADICFPINRR